MRLKPRLDRLETAADPRVGTVDDLILALTAEDPDAAWTIAWERLPNHLQREMSAFLLSIEDDDVLTNAKWVSGQYESSTRVENLSWTHHREAAASLALRGDDSSRTTTLMAGAADRKETLLVTDLTDTAAERLQSVVRG